MIIPLVLIVAFGLWRILLVLKTKAQQKVFSALFLIILFLEIVFFTHQYLVHQKQYKVIVRDDGAQEIVKYIDSQKDNWELVVVHYGFGSNSPFYYLFFVGIFDNSINLDISNSNSDFVYKNIIFSRNGCPSHRADHYVARNVLYVDEAACEVKPNRQEVFRVIRADLTEAFRAYKVVQPQ